MTNETINSVTNCAFLCAFRGNIACLEYLLDHFFESFDWSQVFLGGWPLYLAVACCGKSDELTLRCSCIPLFFSFLFVLRELKIIFYLILDSSKKPLKKLPSHEGGSLVMEGPTCILLLFVAILLL